MYHQQSHLAANGVVSKTLADTRITTPSASHLVVFIVSRLFKSELETLEARARVHLSTA